MGVRRPLFSSPHFSPLAHTGPLNVNWHDQMRETLGSRAPASAEMHQEGQEIPIERGAEEKNNDRSPPKNAEILLVHCYL